MAGKKLRRLTEEDVFPARPDNASGDLVSETIAADAAEPDRPRREPGFTGDGVIQHLVGHLESHQGRPRSGPGLKHAPSCTGKEPALRQPCVARSGDFATSSGKKGTKFWRECG